MPALLTERDIDAHIAWKAAPTCTGNCNQGRACDCVADVDYDSPPMTRVGIALILAPWAVGVVAFALYSALA